MKCKIIKNTLLFSVITCSLLSASCTKQEENKIDLLRNDIKMEVPNEEINIDFWHVYSSSGQDLMGGFIKEANKNYKNIKVIDEDKGGYEDLNKAILKSIKDKDTPTIALCYPEHIEEYVDEGIVVPLDQFINSDLEEFKLDTSDFVQEFLNEGKSYDEKGTLLTIPFAKSTYTMFYNKTFFDEHNLTVPATWDELWNLCKIIKELPQDGINYLNEPFSIDLESDLFEMIALQSNVPYTSHNGRLSFDYTESLNIIKNLKTQYDSGYIKTKNDNVYNERVIDGFLKRNQVISIGSTSSTGYYCPSTTKVDGVETPVFEVGVAPIPQVDVNNPKYLFKGPSLVLLANENTSDDQLCAAYLLMKEMVSTKLSAAFSIVTGYEPVRTSSYASAQYVSHLMDPKVQYKAQFIQKTACLTSTFKGSYVFTSPIKEKDELKDELNKMIYRVFDSYNEGEDLDLYIQKEFEKAIEIAEIRAR